MYSRFFGILLIGLVIKVMDDFLDEELDRLKGDLNWASRLGRGILPYTMIIMVLALYLNFQEGVGFFTASYAIGMFHDYNTKLPSGLTGWQESIIVLAGTVFITSLKLTFSTFILILALQLFDDFIDFKHDLNLSNNFRYKLGTFNSLLIGTLLLLVSMRFFFHRLILFILAVLIIYSLNFIWKKLCQDDF